jgi:hypothetical protein
MFNIVRKKVESLKEVESEKELLEHRGEADATGAGGDHIWGTGKN